MSNPVEKLQQMITSGDAEAAALVHFENSRRYFTHFPSSDGVLFVTAGAVYLLVDFRYGEAAQKRAKNCEVICFSILNNSLKELAAKHGVKRVYLEQEHLTVSQAKRFEKVFAEISVETVLDETLDKAVRSLRMLKSPQEVAKLEASQQITDAAFTYILPYIKEGVTERDIALEIEFFMRKQGAEAIAFELIVAAGRNGSMCHAVPSDYAVQRGDFITMDTGALLDGYHSDMTRTVALHSVSDEQRIVYEKVLEAHLKVIDTVKPGIPCSQIDKVARDIIESEYPGAFGHGLGHGVGFEIHEEPRFSKFDDTPCAAGMVVTDEPGIYLPGKFGVRIEDMLLITETGCRTLTKSPKELMIL